MVQLVDNTLRDDEQSPGVVFTRKEKLTMAYLLADSGIRHIEAGCPAVCEEERETLRLLAESGIKATIYTWNRATKSEVDLSLECGIKDIIVSMPVSDQMIEFKLKKSRDQVLLHFKEIVEYATQKGARVVCGLEDASRANPDFLARLCGELENSGASRIRLSDTVGILTPEETGKMISNIRGKINLPIEFHGHNNFGLANANAISAYLAGAEFIDTSILGIADGCGITPLEEFVGAVEFVLKEKTGVSIAGLKSLSDTLLLALKLELWPWKPLLGKNNYTHESGIHVDGLLKNTANYEIVSPEVFGIRRKIVLGKHSGRHSVEYCCRMLGLETSMIDLEKLTDIIKDASIQKKDILSIEEIKAIYFKMLEEKNNYQSKAVCY